MLALGLPTGPVTAVLMAALLIHGIPPGPTLVNDHPDVFWGFVASMYVGNVMLLALNLPLVGLFVNVLRIPYAYLYPLVIMFCIVGVYVVNSSVVDVWIMLGMGVLGYLLRKLGLDPAPLVLGLVISPIFEMSLRQSLIMSDGNWTIFFTRPIALVLLLVAVTLLALSGFRCCANGVTGALSSPRSRRGDKLFRQPALLLNKLGDLRHPVALAQVGHHERSDAAHALGIPLHDLKRGAHVGGEIDLIDHQEIGAGDAGTALGRDLVAGRDIDDVEREVGELGRERRRQVVAAELDQDQVELGELAPHVGDGGEIDRGIFANRGVRATAGLHTGDAFRRKRAGADQVLGIPFGVDIVGDGGDLVALTQMLAQASINAVLPDPTGPPTPTRKGPCGLFIVVMTETTSCTGSRGACWRYRRGR